jgi:hypothetical protein
VGEPKVRYPEVALGVLEDILELDVLVRDARHEVQVPQACDDLRKNLGDDGYWEARPSLD